MARLRGAVMIVLAFVAFGDGGMAWSQSDEPNRNATQAQRCHAPASNASAPIEAAGGLAASSAARLALASVPHGLAAPGAVYAMRAEGKIWNVLQEPSEVRRIKQQAGAGSVVFSPDGRLFAIGSKDKTARLWEVATGKEVITFPPDEAEVASVAFSPDGKLLAAGKLAFHEAIREHVAPRDGSGRTVKIQILDRGRIDGDDEFRSWPIWKAWR